MCTTTHQNLTRREPHQRQPPSSPCLSHTPARGRARTAPGCTQRGSRDPTSSGVPPHRGGIFVTQPFSPLHPSRCCVKQDFCRALPAGAAGPPPLVLSPNSTGTTAPPEAALSRLQLTDFLSITFTKTSSISSAPSCLSHCDLFPTELSLSAVVSHFPAGFPDATTRQLHW